MDASIASVSTNFPPQAIAAIWSVALSAIVASMTWLFRAYDTARKSRLTRLRALVALRAEIESKRLAQNNNFDANTVEDLCRRMAADPAYIPHVPLDEYRSYVFGLIGSDLLLLPRFAVRHVVAFYEWDKVLHYAFVQLGSTEFAALSPERRIATWRAIPDMTSEYRRRVRAALGALRRYERLDHAKLAMCRRRLRRTMSASLRFGRARPSARR